MGPRRSARVLDSDSDGEGGAVEAGAPPPTQPEVGWSTLPETEQNECATVIVRLMLARHSEKLPVRRAELTKAMFPAGAVVKSRRSIFQGAFTLAQVTLQNIHTCEMLEVVKQVKGGRGGAATPAARATATQTAPDGSQTQVSGGGAKAYILVSTLPQQLRPRCEEEWAVRSLLGIIASIVMLTPECRVEEQDLAEALGRAAGVSLDEAGGHKQLNGGNVRELIQSTLVKQWYLEREREGMTYFYSMGPRLRAELDDDSLIQFVMAVYNLGNAQQNEMDPTTRRELQERLDSARGVQLAEDVDSS
jgi:hypothetical protein